MFPEVEQELLLGIFPPPLSDIRRMFFSRGPSPLNEVGSLVLGGPPPLVGGLDGNVPDLCKTDPIENFGVSNIARLDEERIVEYRPRPEEPPEEPPNRSPDEGCAVTK